METQSLAIRDNGLQKSYQKLQVLKGVDFAVASGSIFALLGSNGAGKTTMCDLRGPHRSIRTECRCILAETVHVGGDVIHGHDDRRGYATRPPGPAAGTPFTGAAPTWPTPWRKRPRRV